MNMSHVLIVGGSSGIGEATARQMLGLGMRVTIAARDKDKLDKAIRFLGPPDTACIRGIQLDGSAYEEIPAKLKAVGQFDHLVLAMGSSQGVGPMRSVSIDSIRAGFSEKVFPHFAIAQAALDILPSHGTITFITALGPHLAVPGTAGISMANAAISTLSRTLALELAPIRVNEIAPGIVDTPWWNAMPEERKNSAFENYAKQAPVGRVGTPEDVADAICFVIGNKFMTGQTIYCDGGYRLSMKA
ncbi:hypothetical protein BD324DRAFT_480453 [Kockovaella imperatae]|uniref:Short-chain dehydrogenase n=1 Tax=Kockovaella imperatae TaxID=4999 RepID=A0A1Y1UDT8_9TREE|nr:hypothetical protein BD324DRAFT_480453 [Kockovaella imperatae]ORX36208.1 hypothetical protein BD324DRAFT_480453 [Kockovaella imperatae]